VIKEFAVCEIFEKLETLVDPYKTDSSLRISFKCDDQELKIRADEQVITQVMLKFSCPSSPREAREQGWA
jgi:hypothetical protein